MQFHQGPKIQICAYNPEAKKLILGNRKKRCSELNLVNEGIVSGEGVLAGEKLACFLNRHVIMLEGLIPIVAILLQFRLLIIVVTQSVTVVHHNNSLTPRYELTVHCPAALLT